MIFCLLLLFLEDSDSIDNWVSVEPPRIGARLKMPKRPVFSERVIKPVRDQDEITVRTRSVEMPNGKVNFTFVYHDENNLPANRKQVNAILDGAVTGAIAFVNGEIVRQNEIFMKVHKGRDFVYRCEIDDAKLQTSHKLKIRSRVILVQKRLFSMNYIAEESAYREDQADMFFESFELVKTPGDLPPKPRAGRARELANELASASKDSN